jgi:hypothetical protein
MNTSKDDFSGKGHLAGNLRIFEIGHLAPASEVTGGLILPF